MAEGQAQSSLRHPNVVAVTDLVRVDGRPALVLEYVEGCDLAELLDAGPLSLGQADAPARGMLVGLGAAHREGLVHRDLKPANVLVACVDGRLVPRVADFGLTKLAHGALDRWGHGGGGGGGARRARRR